MKSSHHTTPAHPFLYVGLILIAVAVLLGLLADHPNASDKTILSLAVMARVAVTIGLSALLIAPLCRVLKHRN